MQRNFLLIAFVVFGLLFAGCDKKGGNTIEITGNDQMQFSLKEIKVKAGQKVTLTLKHIGTAKKETTGHNWILLKQGVEGAKFAQEAASAKDQDFIPSSLSDQIVAHTKLLGGGESDTITFDAPPKGTYTFLCSFPGHFAMMHGNFIVE